MQAFDFRLVSKSVYPVAQALVKRYVIGNLTMRGNNGSQQTSEDALFRSLIISHGLHLLFRIESICDCTTTVELL